jgi:molecular chaperone GrpE
MEKDQNLNNGIQDDEAKEPFVEKQDDEKKDPLVEKQENEANETFVENQDNELEKKTEETELKEVSLEEKIKDLEDKVIRTFAEMENQRRRFEKERDDAFNYGGFTFAKETLSLIDNLDRSKQILEKDEMLKNTDALKKTLEHFDIINKDMISILKKNGITPVVSIGRKLDPNIHQAMMEIDDDQKEPGTIIHEIQRGFMMKDRLLRPSLVGISKKNVKKDEKSE